MSPAGPITSSPAGVRLHLRVQPRASCEEVAGLAGDAIRVRLAAPPVDGAANEALVRFLAAPLDVSRAAVALDSGHTGRTNVGEVAGLSAQDACRRLGL